MSRAQCEKTVWPSDRYPPRRRKSFPEDKREMKGPRHLSSVRPSVQQKPAVFTHYRPSASVRPTFWRAREGRHILALGPRNLISRRISVIALLISGSLSIDRTLLTRREGGQL